MDSLALAQDSDAGSIDRTPSPVNNEEERIMLEAHTWSNHPLEPNVTVLSSSSSSDDAAVLPTPQVSGRGSGCGRVDTASCTSDFTLASQKIFNMTICNGVCVCV